MHSIPFIQGLALVLLVFAVHAAHASDDDCDAPPQTWRPRSEVDALAQRNGWQVERLKIDDGCYEIVGRDAQGRRFSAKVDPSSLQVISLKHGHREREHEHGERRSAASVPAGASVAGQDGR